MLLVRIDRERSGTFMRRELTIAIWHMVSSSVSPERKTTVWLNAPRGGPPLRPMAKVTVSAGGRKKTMPGSITAAGVELSSTGIERQ